ncbi:alpha-galactosidase [Tengunoibacter tsumagoiensis]|uniref:Alpha-glucosidase/alpha-galactosidase n=1 Tax=Tengunoibacter tsumagoiensis TaxID=2014871 RepID=A0A402A6N1_9CHLR|nr:alpha-galactosidase [Tengunoibacter tsumagoiensis]GCE14675.1 alpha-glucosidase/alpha-galactosidase [Tengunoibacter tsumagoiensis]
MTKITFLGAGSAVFARQLITDVLHIDGLEEGTFALVDIDAPRLETAHQIAELLVQRSGKKWQVQSSVERRDVLAGSDFLVNTIEVAGMANVRHDYDIPLKYGVDQCIGDTIGPGGIFKALRTGPAWLDILRDAEELCPNAWVLNYTNPMSILTLTALTATKMRTVGLCHSVQGSSKQLSQYLDVPYEELEWNCAGINHNAWFTVLRHKGEDMYPRLRERMKLSEVYEKDPVRLEMMLYFGAFVTESSGHFSEYVPYFRKRPDLIEKYCRKGYLGESGFYATTWPEWRVKSQQTILDMIEGRTEIPFSRSHEYGSDIIEAVTQHRPTVIYGNVRNTGLIDNLPDGCVEVACLVDRNGVQPTHFGPLPEQLAGLNRSHMTVHTLMRDAIVNKDKEAARYALMMDPLTAAVCSPAEIHALFDEMWETEREYLQPFA